MTEPATTAQDLLRDDILAGGLDAVMQQLTDRVVGQWADPDAWAYMTWLNPTPTGRQRCGGPHPSRGLNFILPTATAQRWGLSAVAL